MSEQTTQSNYWLDVAARDIAQRYPSGEIVVSSGISPSASYHVGHFREIMTAEALAWVLRKNGRTVRHLHVVDNFDPLRKWYDFLPPAKADYAGHPIALVPDPLGDCHSSYADHFYSEFKEALGPIGIHNEHLTIVKSYEDLYLPGHMDALIEKALDHTELIKQTFEKLSNRPLPAEWSPVAVLGDDGKFIKGDISTWNKEAHTLNGIDYRKGHGKLDWRLDWPARWSYLGVNVEPFGAQEHGAAGGSYDTGSVFAREIFGIEPPYGEVSYGHIHRPGESVKMSSSKGNGVTPSEALAIMPPEILRYFIVRGRPEKKIFFDPGVGLYNLIDEFAAAQSNPNHEFRDAYEFAVDGQDVRVISSVPFKHLVTAYQTARGDVNGVMDILKRTEYAQQAADEHDVITAELAYVKNWLASYAPDNVKFSIQDSPANGAKLSLSQETFLDALADSVEAADGIGDGQAMHEMIYDAKEKADVKPNEAFQALYEVLLGQSFGPKAGWFLASLEQDWLVKRLRRKQ